MKQTTTIAGPMIEKGMRRIEAKSGTVASKEFDIWLALAFGVIGYFFKKLDYPIAPLVLAMVIGDKAEDAFRQSMIFSQGSLSIFWSNPLVASLMAIGLALLLFPLLGSARRGIRKLTTARAAKA